MASAGWIVRGVPCALALAAVVVLAFAIPASASNTMAVQPDGKIVLAGGSEQAYGSTNQRAQAPTIVRFQSDGSLDSGFGARGGIVDFRESPDVFSAIAATRRGVYGTLGGVGGYGLVRYESDGDVDSDFGTEGEAEVLDGFDDLAVDPSTVLVQLDGSLIVGGDAHEGTPEREGTAFVQQLSAAGTFPTTVGRIHGTREYGDPFGIPTEEDLLRMPDGALIAAGALKGGVPMLGGYLARLDFGGYDTSFGEANGGGLVRVDPSGAIGATALATDAVGRILVAFDDPASPGVERLDANGVRDRTFGIGGVARLPDRGVVMDSSAVAVQSDGGVLVGGAAEEPCPPSNESCWNVFVARFDANGVLDRSFGDSGIQFVPRRADRGEQPLNVDLATTDDGSALVSTTPAFRGESEFLLARLTPQGRLDPAFGQEGVVTAAPCQGTVAERRRSGCLSHARASLGTDGLASGRPSAQLRVVTDNLLDPMSEVALVLPPALRGVPRMTKRAKAFELPRGARGKRVKPGRIQVRLNLGARQLSLVLPPGVLRRVRKVSATRKLQFRVDVGFYDGSTQQLRLRVKP